MHIFSTVAPEVETFYHAYSYCEGPLADAKSQRFPKHTHSQGKTRNYQVNTLHCTCTDRASSYRQKCSLWANVDILFSKSPNLLYHWATPPLHVTANLVQRAQTTSPNVQCYAQRGQTYRGSYATPTSTQCLSCCRLADSSGSLPARTYTNKRCRICTQNDSNREHPCFFFLLSGIVCNVFAACLIALLHVVYIVFKWFFLFFIQNIKMSLCKHGLSKDTIRGYLSCLVMNLKMWSLRNLSRSAHWQGP